MDPLVYIRSLLFTQV